MDPTSQYALAYALTTTAGLRGFLTLLAASIATHVGWIHPTAAFAWLGSDGAMAVLAVFSGLEFVGDKVPIVDHALHVVQTGVRPLAAAILVGATAPTESHAQLYSLMALGAVNALVVHGASVTARAASTTATLGAGNVVLSLVEDAVAIVGIVLSFVAPVVAAILALALVITIVLVARAWYRRARAPHASAAVPR